MSTFFTFLKFENSLNSVKMADKLHTQKKNSLRNACLNQQS